jgi:hypothetical protein
MDQQTPQDLRTQLAMLTMALDAQADELADLRQTLRELTTWAREIRDLVLDPGTRDVGKGAAGQGEGVMPDEADVMPCRNCSGSHVMVIEEVVVEPARP